MAYATPRRRTSSGGSFSSVRSPPTSPSPFAMLGPGSLSSMPPAQQSQIFGSMGMGKLKKKSSPKAPVEPPAKPLRSSRAPPVPSVPYHYRQSSTSDGRGPPPPAYSRDPVPATIPARADLYGGFGSGSVIDYGSPSPSYRTSPTTSSASSSSVGVASAPAPRVGLGRKLLKSSSSGSESKRSSRPSVSPPSSIPFPSASSTRDQEADILITSRSSRSPSISSVAESIPGVPYSRARLPSFGADGDPRSRARTSSFCGSSIRAPSVHRAPAVEDGRSRRSSGSGTTIGHDPRRDSAGFDSDQSCAAIIRAVKVSTSSTRPSSSIREPSPAAARQLQRRPSADERQRFLALGEQQTLKERAERQKKVEKEEGKGWLAAARKRANSLGRTREYWAN